MGRILNIAASLLEQGKRMLCLCPFSYVWKFSARGFQMVCSIGPAIGSSSLSATTGVAEGNKDVDVLEAVQRLTWAVDTGRTLDGKEEVVSACNLRFQ
jgi:hypothetical protein